MLQIVRLRLIQGFALIAALVSLGLFLVRPDIERYLEQNLPGHHMPDAFHGLNGIMAIFMLFVTATVLLVMRIETRRQYVLLIPLLFGPTACITGWFLTENLNDPNWFLLFAPTTIGMLVSCAVTTILSIVTKKSTEQRVADEALDQPF
jgi:cytochrome bd-type quinol oxidase subunit 1